MNSDNNHSKTTGGLGSDLKPLDPKTAAPGAPGKASEKPAQATVREGSPQPEIKAPTAGGLAGGTPHPLTADMRRRWGNFADADLKNVKTRADLSTAVQSKYGITAEQAAKQVQDWAVGRQF